jgi:hypothetical protein
MLRRNESGTLVGLAILLSLGSSVALAQQNPELGETGGTATGTAGASTSAGASAGGTWQPPTGTQVEAANDNTAVDPQVETAASGDTDHQSVTGHFGVGFLGVMGVPAAGCNPGAGCALDFGYTVSAPTIGLRYWLQEGLGIEVALGIGIESSGSTVTTTGAAGTTTDTNGPSLVAFALHGGLPLVFAESKHFAFELIPELNFGFATGSWDDTSAANADLDLSGLLFELGARVGAEIQFGFIDIPQLSLQGTVGLHLRVENRSASTAGGETSAGNFRFGTTMQGEPWDIFTGALAAIYYF